MNKHTIAIVFQKPDCDFCTTGVGSQAQYDGATVQGPWANMCNMHFRQYGKGLGLGRGQKLMTPEQYLDWFYSKDPAGYENEFNHQKKVMGDTPETAQLAQILHRKYGDLG